MGSFVLKDARVEINSVDLSDRVLQVTINYEADEEDETAMSDLTHIFQGGLLNWSMEFEFKQDFAAGKVDATLFSLVGSTTALKVRPTSSSISSTNPEYQGTGLLSSYPPLAGSVGQLAKTKAQFRSAGTLNRATS